jgi:hypothetical protein
MRNGGRMLFRNGAGGREADERGSDDDDAVDDRL